MSFATDFEIGFSTKQALRDKRKLEQALESLGRKAERTGKRMDRALGRGVAQSTRNLKGVSKSINQASQSAKRMERNLRAVTNESRKLAIQQRAVTATTRTAATQAIAMGGGGAVGGAVGGVGSAAAATKAQGRAAAKTALANRTLAGSFAGVTAGAAAARAALIPLTVGIAALAGGAGLGAAVKSAVTFADEIGKTAGKLGVTTDALQEFAFAAGQSGVNASTATMALQRFTRRAAEAAKDTGEAKEALKSMGIQLTDNQGNLRESQELLADVAEAMKNTESAGERLRLGFKLFDSEGVALVNMLIGGREAFNALRREAHELGVVFDEDLIRRAEELKNQLDAASLSVSVNFKEALIDLVPVILKVTEGLGYMAEGVAFFADTVRPLEEKTVEGLQVSFAKVREEIDKTREIIAQLNQDIKGDKAFSIDFFSDPASKIELEAEVLRLERLQERFDKIASLLGKRAAEKREPPPKPEKEEKVFDVDAAKAEATRIESLVERLTRERVAAERSITTVTLEEAQKRRAAIGFQFVDAIEEAKGNAEAIAAAQNAFVKKTAALNAELANKTIKTEKTLTDEILAMLNTRAKATQEFGKIQVEITQLIDDGTISTDQGARALDNYAESLGLIDERAKAATERLEGMGKALTNDVLGKVSDALVDFDFSTLTDSLFAANRQLLVGFVQEGLRPVIGKAFEGLAESAGPTTAIGKMFSGAAEEAFGGTGATVGEDLIIAAIEEQTKVIKGEAPGARPVSTTAGGGRVRRGGAASGGSIPGGLTVNCVCECECCCCCDRGMGGGLGGGLDGGLGGSRGDAAKEAANEQREQDEFFAARQEVQIDKVDNTVWKSGEGTQNKIANLTTENRFGFSSLIQKASERFTAFPDWFAQLSQSIVMGLTPKGPSSTDKVLGIIGAVASSGSGVAAGVNTGQARSGGIVGRTRFPASGLGRSAFVGAPRFQRCGVIGDGVPILAHSGELITPLEGGRLPVTMNNGVPEVRTPGGDRVPVDIRGERDVAPVIFGAGAIVVMASPGERLDQTVGQAVEKAFVAGARQQRRNQGRAA